MPTYNRQAEPGLFLETTNILDVESIYELDINSDQFKEFLVNMRQTLNQITLAVNLKDTGYYDQREFVCGQVYFPDPILTSASVQTPTWRQVFRRTYLWPTPLPNTGAQVLAHGLDLTPNTFTFTRIYGCASQKVPHVYIPIPYVSAALAPNIIELFVDNVNINIVTNFDASAFDVTYVVLEYIKQ